MTAIPFLFKKAHTVNDFFIKSFSGENIYIRQGTVSTNGTFGGTLVKTDYLTYDASRLLNGISDIAFISNTLVATSPANILAKENTTSRHISYKIANASDLPLGFYGLWGRFIDLNNYESLLLEVYDIAGTKNVRYKYKLVEAGVAIYDVVSASLNTLSDHDGSWWIANVVTSDQILYIDSINLGTNATPSTISNATITVGRAYLNGIDYYWNGSIDLCTFRKGLVLNKNYTVATNPEFAVDGNNVDAQVLEDSYGTYFSLPKLIQENRVGFRETGFINDIELNNNSIISLGWGGSIGPSYGIFFDFEIPSTFTATVGGGGTLASATVFYYAITAVDTESGIESCLSGIKEATTSVGNQTITLNNIFNTRNITTRSSTSHLVKRIYRSTNSTIGFKYIATIAWTTASYVDNGGANSNGHNYIPSNLIGFVSHSLSPAGTPAPALIAGPGISGTFAYIATNYDPLTGIESPCSLESISVTPANNVVAVTYSGGLGNGYYLRLYRRNIGAGSPFWFLLTELTTGVTAGIFNDNIPETGLSSVRITNRTIVNISGLALRSDIVTKHLDRIWIVDDSQLNRIRFSEIGRYSQFNTLSFIDIFDPSDPITALFSFLGNLLIFKEFSVFVLYGDTLSTFRIVKLTAGNDIGTSSKLTIKVINNVLFFANSKGAYQFNGSTFTPISNSIKDIFTTQLSSNGKAVMSAAVDLEDRFYLLAITNSNGSLITETQNNNLGIDIDGFEQILVFHYDDYSSNNKEIWTKLDITGGVIADGTLVRKHTPIVTPDGLLCVMDGNSERGIQSSSIDYEYVSNQLSPNPYRVNRFDHLKVTLDTSEFTTVKTVNVGFIVSNVTTGVAFSVLAQEDLEIKPSTRAKFIQTKISGSTNEKLVVTGIKINAEVLGFR